MQWEAYASRGGGVWRWAGALGKALREGWEDREWSRARGRDTFTASPL